MSVQEELAAILGVIEVCDDSAIHAREAEDRAEKLAAHIAEQDKALGCPKWWTAGSFDAARWPAAAQVLAGDEKRNILFAAPTNCGKSHAACALARLDAAAGKTLYRLREHSFYPLWDQSRYRESEGFKDAVTRAKRADVLVYDDLGKVEIVRGNGFALTPFGCVLFDIFDERAERRLRNIVTTRYPGWKELESVVGGDFLRRVLQIEANDKSRGHIVTMCNGQA